MASCDLTLSSSASSLPITSNPEDGPSAPSATVIKKRKHYDKTFKLKVIMFAEKFSNREAEKNRPRPRIQRLPATHLKLIERAHSNQGNTVYNINLFRSMPGFHYTVTYTMSVEKLYFNILYRRTNLGVWHMVSQAIPFATPTSEDILNK